MLALDLVLSLSLSLRQLARTRLTCTIGCQMAKSCHVTFSPTGPVTLSSCDNHAVIASSFFLDRPLWVRNASAEDPEMPVAS